MFGVDKIEVHKAKERASISIPYEVFLDAKGAFKFDSAINRGLVEVRQGKAGLVLKIGGIVGRLPLNSNHALDISPKFSMGNLSRLIALSEGSFFKRANISRSYQTTNPDGYLPELLLKSFGIALQQAQSEGVHRQYIKQTATTSLRPRINFQKSAQTFWARGQSTRVVTDQFYFSTDNMDNQVLKCGCFLAINLSNAVAELKNEATIFAHALNSLSSVSQKSTNDMLRTYDLNLSYLPTFKIGYRKAIEISLELIRRSGVSYDRFDDGIKLPSFLINLDNVFESYVRNVLKDGLGKRINDIAIGDGNVSVWQKPLFDDTNRGLAKPDLLIKKSGNAKPYLVGDVKYKRDISVEDRYQVIAYALSYQCKKALIIYPAEGTQGSKLVRIGKIGGDKNGIDLFQYQMDLSSDLKLSEVHLIEEVSSFF